MKHDEAWTLLDALLDGALAAPERWAVSAHLDECPVCRRQLAHQARLRGLVRGRLLAVEIPAGLRERLQSAIATDREPLAPVVAVPYPLALHFAAVLGLVLIALWLFLRVMTSAAAPGSTLPADLALTHALFAHDETLLDVKGDPATVSAWFHDKAGLAVTAPRLAGYELLGGRLAVIDGAVAAQLVYEAEPNDRYLSLLRFNERTGEPADGDSGDVVSLDEQGTMSLVTWTTGGERTALVAAVPESELRRLARNLVPAAEAAPAEE